MVATWPAITSAHSDFLAAPAPARGEATPGDHLQLVYRYWLVGHQLGDGRAPWLDPYSFRPEADAQPNFAGWPFGLLFWPLGAALGLVGGWNVLQILLYVLAGLFACAWLRELGLPRGPALVGGLVFAIAPYRVQQSVGHLLGPISLLLPLSLWAFERARRGSVWWLALAGAAIASISLSGQVHLALGAIPFFVAYAVCRTRNVVLLGGAFGGAIAAIGAGLLVRETLIEGSTESGGRTLAEISRYSARAGDFLSRNVDQSRAEQFVYLGWATPLVALAGLVLLLRARRYALAILLGLGVIVPVVLALGTRTPVYELLWDVFPPLRFPRVPERLLPIACLCIAALVAFVLARTRRLAVAAIAVLLVLVDLRVSVYAEATPGDPRAATPSTGGRLLELPVFDPGVHYGGVYLWYDTAAHRERPGGYSTTAPEAAKRLSDRIHRLNCGDWTGGMQQELDRLGVSAIALHLGLYDRNPAVAPTAWFAWQGLLAQGWTVQKTAGTVWVFERGRIGLLPAVPAPNPTQPVFCQGWYADTGAGRYMSERHAGLWIYGTRDVKLRFESMQPAVTVHGGRGERWRLVAVDVPRLVRVSGQKRPVGAKLVEVTGP